MESKYVTLSNGKTIEIYDNLFSFIERETWYSFIKNSMYKINGSDGEFTDKVGQQIYSAYSTADLHRMGFFESDGFKLLDNKHNLLQKQIKQIRVNLSTNNEANCLHTDGCGTTFLYYSNIEWDITWGGHTLFMDDNIQEAVHTSLYKPGRVLLFDGTIPHMIMTPTIVAKKPRFSLALQFN